LHIPFLKKGSRKKPATKCAELGAPGDVQNHLTWT